MLDPYAETTFKNDTKVFFKEIIFLAEVKQLLITKFQVFDLLDQYLREKNIS